MMLKKLSAVGNSEAIARRPREGRADVTVAAQLRVGGRRCAPRGAASRWADAMGKEAAAVGA
jgi:hypothetical protein